MDAVIEDKAAVEMTEVQKMGPNGDGNSAVATPNGRSRKTEKIRYDESILFIQARIQLLAKGEVVKIMENNVLLPQAANVSDRMPRKRVPQPARISFSGYNRQ